MGRNQEVPSGEVTFELRLKEAQERPGRIEWAEHTRACVKPLR